MFHDKSLSKFIKFMYLYKQIRITVLLVNIENMLILTVKFI